jgi:hypothetical protein
MHQLAKSLIAAAALLAFGASALAGLNALKLEYVLSGPPIAGVVPSGRAVIDQPRLPGTLTCEVQNVNLPDGTVLVVSVNGYRAGTLTLVGGRARMQALIPFQVRTGPFEIYLGNVVIMTGRFKI